MEPVEREIGGDLDLAPDLGLDVVERDAEAEARGGGVERGWAGSSRLGPPRCGQAGLGVGRGERDEAGLGEGHLRLSREAPRIPGDPLDRQEPSHRVVEEPAREGPMRVHPHQVEQVAGVTVAVGRRRLGDAEERG